MVVGLLGRVGHAVDERHRRREVVELEVADDLVALPRQSRPCRRCPPRRRSAVPYLSSDADRVASCPTRPSCCSRSGSATRSSASPTSATIPTGGARPAARHARHAAARASSPAEIDAAVRERTEARRGDLRASTRTLLRELEPDLIVTQALCPVCAVSYDDVARDRRASCPRSRRSSSLDPTTLGETLGDVRTIAAGHRRARRRRRPRRAPARRGSTRSRERRRATRGAARVAALEWFDPVFVAGHWTPQLIELAGGIDVLGFAGEHSEQTTWEAVAAAAARGRRRDAVRLRRRALAPGGARPTPSSCARVGARRGRRGRRVGVLLAPGPAARRRARDARPRAAPRPRARGARGRRARRSTLVDRRPLPRTVLYLHSSAGRYGADRQLHAARDRPGPASATGRSSCCPTTARSPTTCAPPASRCSCARSPSCAAR